MLSSKNKQQNSLLLWIDFMEPKDARTNQVSQGALVKESYKENPLILAFTNAPWAVVSKINDEVEDAK